MVRTTCRPTTCVTAHIVYTLMWWALQHVKPPQSGQQTLTYYLAGRRGRRTGIKDGATVGGTACPTQDPPGPHPHRVRGGWRHQRRLRRLWLQWAWIYQCSSLPSSRHMQRHIWPKEMLTTPTSLLSKLIGSKKRGQGVQAHGRQEADTPSVCWHYTCQQVPSGAGVSGHGC